MKLNKKQKRILKWILMVLGIIAFILIIKNLDILSVVEPLPSGTGSGGSVTG